MQPVTKFKTQFVKMTKDPGKHAADLETVLNQLTADGWEMTRLDHDMKKGTLIIAHRVEVSNAGKNAAPPRMAVIPFPLAALFGGAVNPESPEKLSKESREVIYQVLDKIEGNPKGTDETVIASAVEMVCRKYPSPVLKTAASELKAHAEHHRKTQHESPDEKCARVEQLECIIKALEKQVAQSIV